MIYSLGGEFDFNKVHKTYQKLYNDINNAYLNLEENLNNLSNVFKSNDYKNEKDVLLKYKVVEQKIKDFDSLTKKYKEQIDLGMIQTSNLEKTNELK